MALAQGLHFRDFAHWLRPFLCPSGDLDWWAPPFDPSYISRQEERRFREWHREGCWYVYAFTELEVCNYLELNNGYFRTTWKAVVIARIELRDQYFRGIPGNEDELLDAENSDA